MLAMSIRTAVYFIFPDLVLTLHLIARRSVLLPLALALYILAFGEYKFFTY